MLELYYVYVLGPSNIRAYNIHIIQITAFPISAIAMGGCIESFAHPNQACDIGGKRPFGVFDTIGWGDSVYLDA
jgi:hypothetical protein